MTEIIIREAIPDRWGGGGRPASWSTRMHWVMRVASAAPRSGPARLTRRDRDVREQRFPLRCGELLITLADHRHPYGRTTSGRGYLTHIVDELYLVWYRGQVVDSAVRWRCGATSRMFELLDDPTSTMCVACPLERSPRGRF